jgi:DNA-binding transcriptional LysR family regulator
MIELRHLRAFRAVMSTGSTVGAARALGVSQPSVSRLLAEMEAAQGESLFTRANGRLAARPVAEVLLADVERALNAVDGVIGGAGGRGMSLGIAAPGGIMSAVFGPALRRLMDEFPDLRILTEIMSYHDTLNAVAMGRVDVGLVKAPVDHPGLVSIPLVTVGTEVVSLPDHRLSRLDEVPPSALVGVPLILLGRHRPFRVQLEDVLLRAGVTPNVVIETHAVSVACGFVAQGLGITVANALLARTESRGRLASRPFLADIKHSFCLVHARNPVRQQLIGKLAGNVADAIDAVMDDAAGDQRHARPAEPFVDVE